MASKLPYKTQLPDQIVIHLMKFVVMWISAVPHKNGISTVMSPREMVLGMKMDFKKHCRVRFGAYVEASCDEMVTNTLRDRTEECIALGPTGNLQGSIACFNLNTGRVVSRRTITVLPMSDRIIKRLCVWERNPSKSDFSLAFLDWRQLTYAWDDEAPEVDKVLMQDEVIPMADIPAKLPGVPLAASPPIPFHQFGRSQIKFWQMLISRHLTTRVKGRACANGSKQRDYIDKESAALPTVATDSLMITAAIDGVELRDIVTLDIPGAFLHADLDEEESWF
eukprot:CCRYP_018545-RA/>CCRYP_018545-RA protein AED:0.54 eAED:0.53 QI:0/0/0/1/0/0/3/0/279